MKNEDLTWLTDEARIALDVWEQQHRGSWIKEFIDPKEVRADVEAHLWHARGESEKPVTLDQVKEAIQEMGFAAPVEPYPLVEAHKAGFFALIGRFLGHPFFWGVWPLIVVLVEMATGLLAGMFFDPISRTPQAVLLLSFCVLGTLGLLKKLNEQRPAWLSILRGAGLVVAGYWSLLLLPVLVIGFLGYGLCIVYTMGIGILAIPLFLICMATAAAPLYLFYGFLRSTNLERHRGPWLIGILLGLGLLLIVEGPSYVTRYAVVKDDPGLIRKLGSEETLLSMCYEGRVGKKSFTDTTGFIPSLTKWDIFGRAGGVNLKEIGKRRELYYRTTGRSFNVPGDGGVLPDWLGGRSQSRGVTLDEDLGGDGVAGRVADLDLSASRLDAHINASSRLGYWEWTMEFGNSGKRNKEARMQLLLPADGVVSRLTLWVNDEPQEAAFSSTAKVTKAYKSIAVQERRDPVLVRWVGADRVLVQCFPILPNKDMRIRIGITAPLDAEGRLFLPRIIEKNFGVPEDLESSIWIQGDTEMSLDGLQGKGAKGKWRETHGKLPARELMARHTHVKCDLPEEPAMVWAEDPFAGNTLVRTRLPLRSSGAKDDLVIVIDGSSYFSKWTETADEAIAELREAGHGVRVIVAAQEEIFEDPSTLTAIDFAGGQDCISALEAGLNLATSTGSRHLVWLHGAQPVTFSTEEGFLQLLERGFHQVDFSVVDLDGGPNRLLEKVSKRIGIAGAARPVELDELIPALKGILESKRERYEWKRQEDMPEGGKHVSDQLARWYAWKQVKKASTGSPDRDKLAKLAAKYQLVTPVSGAVVLETKEDYKRFGLKQVDVDTAPSVPGIPEPSTALLVLIGSLMVWRRARIQQK